MSSLMEKTRPNAETHGVTAANLADAASNGAVTIRGMVDADVEAVHNMVTSRHVLSGTMRVPYTSPAQTRRRFEPASGTYHIVAVHAEEVVGFAELITYPEAPRHRHVAEASLVVTRSDWQGRGVGRSLMSAIVELADHWLNIERLSLVAFTENHHAIRLYEDLGFVIEGTMPSYGFGEGRWMDAYMMGRLRPKPVRPTLPV